MSGKILILTEKREAGFQTASNLNDSKLGSDLSKLDSLSKSQGFLEGNNYILSWASGHLFTQLKPSEINEEYQLFRPYMNTADYKMPKLLSEIKVVEASETNKKRQIKIIRDILSRSDIAEIIIMTDADGEGEAIGRDMIYKIPKKTPNCNITRGFNSGSFKAKEAVTKALNGRDSINAPKFERLYGTQQVRSHGDYLLGMKVTKVLCDTYGLKLYTGRVKSFLIGLLGDREDEIKNFVPISFYSIAGKQGDTELKHFYYAEEEQDDGTTKKTKQERYFEKEKAINVINNCNGVQNSGNVVEATTETTVSNKKSRPLPLSGTDFVSIMGKKYKVKGDDANEILSYLRTEGFTTYQGTNGRYFGTDSESDLKIAFVSANSYFNTNVQYSSDVIIINNKEAETQNHTPLAITSKIPTSTDIANWSKHKLPKLKEAYELIAKHILVHFLEDDEIIKQSLVVNIADNLFFANGQKAIKQGWRTIIDMEVKNTLFESNYKEGDKITLNKVELKSGETKPPVLFTETTLLEIMLNVTKVFDGMIEEELNPEKLKDLKYQKKLLKACEGIGTDRTRVQIISDLITTELVKQDKLGLMLTPNGQILYTLLPDKLKSITFTAYIENSFEDIRKGIRTYEDVIKEIDDIVMNEFVMQIVENPIKEYINMRQPKTENKKIDYKCPLCGGDLLETAKTYKCEHNEYKDGKQSGCKFSIFKDQSKFFGREITSKDLVSLFKATKENPLIDGKSGIYIDTNNQYFVVAVFERKEVKADELVETPKTFKLNDKFVWKNCFFKDLTKKEAEALLKGSEVTLKRKTRDGKDYEVKVKLDETKAGSVIKI